MKQTILFLIRTYQVLISPLFPPSCRFYPSCSEYMINAITKRGLIRGLFMGVRRLSKCHPFHPGGYDPVN